MVETTKIKSGDKSYTDQKFMDASHTVRQDDGFIPSTGTKIGETGSLTESLVVIKSDSGAKDTKIKTP